MGQKITPLYAETRILLNLWSLDEPEVSKSKFVPSSTSQAYKTALEQLEVENALSSRQKTKRTKVYSLTTTGKQRLAKGLADEQFVFQVQVGAKTANALLKWFRQQGGIAGTSSPNGQGKASEIDSYEDFAQVLIQTYDQLNHEYKFDDLVPIYRIRRSLDTQLSRSQFNEWLLEMQANDELQLIGGEMPELTPDKAEDSIQTALGGTRYYAKRLGKA